MIEIYAGEVVGVACSTDKVIYWRFRKSLRNSIADVTLALGIYLDSHHPEDVQCIMGILK